MKARTLILLLIAAGLTGAGGYGAYWLGMSRGMQMTAPGSPAPSAGGPREAAGADLATGKKVLYWYDPMFPQHRFDKPGKSPFMDMQLVPKYADEADNGTVSISPRVVQNLGVRTAEARIGNLERRFDTVGAIAYNERGVVQLQARTAGFVEKLYARAPLDPVAKGAPLVEMLFPEWTGAQEEYLLLRHQNRPELAPLVEAARQRLALLGMSEEEIAAIGREGRVRQRFTRHAPISGVIAELGVREGMAVMPGHTLFRIVDLSTVWVNAEIPETQAAAVVPGSRVEVRAASYPETKFRGRVSALLPEVNPVTRTVRARIELANPGGKLKPGMFATLSFASTPGKKMLLVPTEAVIHTGARSIVIEALGEGRFAPRQVEVGLEHGGQSEIRKGIAPGATVVVSGQFLIDSEASLTATVGRLQETGQPAPAHLQQGFHRGRGKVVEVNPLKGRVELDHEAIPSLQWPQMKMGFLVEDHAQIAGLKKGDTVEFELRAKPDKDGNYVITRIAPRRKP